MHGPLPDGGRMPLQDLRIGHLAHALQGLADEGVRLLQQRLRCAGRGQGIQLVLAAFPWGVGPGCMFSCQIGIRRAGDGHSHWDGATSALSFPARNGAACRAS